MHQTSIEMGLGPFPTQAIYSGYAGTDEHFSAIWRSAYRMLDIEHILIDDAFVEKDKMITAFPEHATIAMATSCIPSTTPAPGVIRSTHSHTKSHPYDRQHSTKNKVTNTPNIRGMNKFVVSANTRTPRPVNVWAIALANVDRAKATANTWGYWVPEPHILVGSEGILRVQNYLRNWFWVREAWYYMLAHRALRFDPLPSKLWRDWLQNDADKVKEYTKDSKCAKRKAYVMNLFKQHFPDVVSQPPAKDTLLWYNQRYSSPPPDSIIRQIAWEVLEITFRVELLELDRYLVPANSRYNGSGMELFRQERIAKAFPDGQFMRPVQLPTSDRGLAAAHIEDRRHSLSALYDVVRRWPDVPPEIGCCGRLRDMDDAALKRFEAALAKFYVQTFYEVSGRAATIPYHFPLSSAPSSS
ncbi:hypothetical protein PHLCEN_2v6126 [Hermanssonia centrifuga]|uniref:Uncharacterized protein n=1 Tax=Hermanssonia centrifuga TaxID=98765 RepID=A0A2R6P0B4_9APHY|nr:hypothetical protein PHLCEN_2v6126 [Hermanssonia centrifuga]